MKVIETIKELRHYFYASGYLARPNVVEIPRRLERQFLVELDSFEGNQLISVSRYLDLKVVVTEDDKIRVGYMIEEETGAEL